MRTLNKLSADSTLPNRPLHSDHEDRPGYMLANNLKQIADEASQLARVTTDKDNAAPWVESKIDRAAQAVDNVHDYAKYKNKSAAYSLGTKNALDRLGVLPKTAMVIKQAIFAQMAAQTAAPAIQKAIPASIGTKVQSAGKGLLKGLSQVGEQMFKNQKPQAPWNPYINRW